MPSGEIKRRRNAAYKKGFADGVASVSSPINRLPGETEADQITRLLKEAGSTLSPQTHLVGTEDQRGVGIGMAIAAGIIMRCWGQEVYAREILGAAGLDTLDKLKASGVDQYDIEALMPVVATTEDQPDA